MLDFVKAAGNIGKAMQKAGASPARPAPKSTTAPSPLLRAFDERIRPAAPQPNKAEQEWAQIKKRQDANAAGNIDLLPDPATQFKENTQTRDEYVKEEAAKAKAQVAADRGKREAALDVDPAEPAKPGKVKTEEMTDAEYNALNSRQRAAIDFNTLLSDAVKHDLSHQDQYKDLGDDAEYQVRSKELFGEDRGSDLFAPETLAVLSKLKIDDKVSDLDDYLGLKVTISEDEIGTIGDEYLSKRGAIVNEADRSRTDLIGQYTSNTEKMRESLAKGTSLLQSVAASVQADDRFLDDVGELGGDAVRPKTQLGYGKGELDAQFQSYYEALNNKEYETLKSADGTYGTPDNILADAKANMDGKAFDSFLDYAEIRSRNTADLGGEMGDTKGAKYRSPEEFRKLLGMEKP